MFTPPLWLPAACIALVLLASLVRGLMLRRAGVRAYGFGHKDHVQAVAERFWKLAVALLAGAVLIAWLAPAWEPALGRPAWSAWPVLRWLAAGIFVVSVVLILAAQATMGASWRVGVPAEGPGALVTGGLFALSRNPVFVGMFGLVLGMVVWSPTMLTAALLPLAASTMAIQTRIEEDALLEKHGAAYTEYQTRTPRWIWPIG